MREDAALESGNRDLLEAAGWMVGKVDEVLRPHSVPWFRTIPAPCGYYHLPGRALPLGPRACCLGLLLLLGPCEDRI